MKLKPAPLRFLLAVINSCLFAVVPAAFGQQAFAGYSLAPGVLIDSDNGVAYVMTPRSRVEAIGLKDGEVVWSSLAAARPIAIRGERIIAQVESAETTSTLSLAALDIKSGAAVGFDTVELGSGVISSIDDAKEYQFAIGAESIDTKTGSLLWRFYRQKLSGPDADLAPVFERFGALNVNETAAVEKIPGGGFKRDTGRPPYSLPRVSRPVSEKPAADKIILDLGSGLRYRLDGVQVPSPSGVTSSTHAMVTTASTTSTAVPPSGGLIITEGSPGEEFPITRRIPGDQFGYSVDGRHIVASAFAGKIEAAEPYRWSVYRRGTYEVVASFMAQTSLAPFVVSQGNVIYIRQPYQRRYGGEMQSYPLALVARDTKSGRVTWTQPIRDTRYKGTVPEEVR
jgi:hypothetical protein